MTGAGSAEVAYELEDSFRTLPGTPVWDQPGENIQVGSASIENNLERARQPDDPRPDGSREGNFEGAFTITFAMTDTTFHELVFPASSPVGLAQSATLAPTATWYLKSEVLSGTEDRFFEGAAVESVAWNYEQNQDFTVQLTCIYANELDSSDADAPSVPSSINQPSKSEIVRWHGIDLTLNSATIEDLQSFSMEVSGMARFRRGQSRIASDAVVGACEPSATIQAILADDTQRTLAYGSSSATDPNTTIDESSATLTVDNPNGTLTTYNLKRIQPTTHDWQDLVSADTDTTDPTDYHVQDITVS